MRFAIFTALIPIVGLWVRPFVTRLPRSARIAAYVAAGLLTITLAQWSVVALLLVLAALWSAGMQPGGSGGLQAAAPAGLRAGAPVLAILAIALFAALTLSGAVTNPDFLMFWAAKGEKFALAHGVDVAFLLDPHHVLMHSDYPPLVPMTYAWTMLGGHALNWFGAIALAPLMLAASTAAVHGFTRRAELAALFAATFAFLFIDNAIAGNAEPFLIFFECVALGALLYDGPPIIAAIALCGCVLTKVEGTAFLLVLLVTRPRQMMRIAIAPIIAIGSWLVFCAHHGLLDAYKPKGGVWHFAMLKPLLTESAMGAMYIPWIIALLLIATTGARKSLPAVLAALGFVAFLCIAWLSTNVESEIAWSAKRVLMTPLLLLLLSGTESSRTEP